MPTVWMAIIALAVGSALFDAVFWAMLHRESVDHAEALAALERKIGASALTDEVAEAVKGAVELAGDAHATAWAVSRQLAEVNQRLDQVGGTVQHEQQLREAEQRSSRSSTRRS